MFIIIFLRVIVCRRVSLLSTTIALRYDEPGQKKKKKLKIRIKLNVFIFSYLNMKVINYMSFSHGHYRHVLYVYRRKEKTTETIVVLSPSLDLMNSECADGAANSIQCQYVVVCLFSFGSSSVDLCDLNGIQILYSRM